MFRVITKHLLMHTCTQSKNAVNWQKLHISWIKIGVIQGQMQSDKRQSAGVSTLLCANWLEKFVCKVCFLLSSFSVCKWLWILNLNKLIMAADIKTQILLTILSSTDHIEWSSWEATLLWILLLLMKASIWCFKKVYSGPKNTNLEFVNLKHVTYT